MIFFEHKRQFFFHVLLLFVAFLPEDIFSSISPFQSEKEGIGWIKLQSDIPIQKVWLDSIEISLRNDYIKLAEGSHILHARAENSGNWYIRDLVDTVKVSANDTLHVIISFPEYKMIYTDPYGAAVWSGEKMLGQTPLLLLKEYLNGTGLRLSKHGYIDTTLTNIHEFSSSIWIPLHVDSNARTYQNQLSDIQLNKTNRQKRYAILTFGLGLLSGSAAYLLKKEADEKFERYLSANNPKDMDRLFKQTEKYDRYAAGTYLLFEVNLLASTYFFFRYLLNRE